MGLLANVDSSILNIKLDHGFEIQTIPESEGTILFSLLENLPHMAIYRKLFGEFHCLTGGKFYFIGNSFDCDIQMNDEGNITALSKEVSTFNNKLHHDYLNPTIRLMRLFKEGDIRMPIVYYFFIDKEIPKSFMWHETSLHVSPELYTLESSELMELQTFIQNTKLPFAEPFLQLAFDNFELSYQTHAINLSFLSLMISLEILFNPREDYELTYSISRNTAVFIGKNREDANTIFEKVKELYRKRGQLVHSGKSKISQEDLLLLRRYVRESIKEIYKMKENRDALLNTLNLCGFGGRSWTKNEADVEECQTK